MSDRTTFAEDEETLDQRIAAAFAKPAESGQLVPLPTVSVTDAIITAQRVAVERDEGKILRNIRVLAAAVGDDWYYRYPVKNNATGQADWIEGPSIKCANNVARMYGNCQVDTRVVDNGDSWIVYARFVDYETGFSYTRPFQQRKGQTSIKSANAARQLDIALQIGVSKAIRNVICNALETYTNFAFEEAKNAIVEKVGKNIERYRDRVTTRLGELGVALSRVEATAGRVAKDWLAADIARIISQLQAIGDGMATIEETWPSGTVETENKQSNLDRFEDQHGPKSGPVVETTAEPPAEPKKRTPHGAEPDAASPQTVGRPAQSTDDRRHGAAKAEEGKHASNSPLPPTDLLGGRDPAFWQRKDGRRVIAGDNDDFMRELPTRLAECRIWAEVDDIERHNAAMIRSLSVEDRVTVSGWMAERREEVRGIG